jgi:hypothetical protein
VGTGVGRIELVGLLVGSIVGVTDGLGVTDGRCVGENVGIREGLNVGI